jgi:hypothetical protein
MIITRKRLEKIESDKWLGWREEALAETIRTLVGIVEKVAHKRPCSNDTPILDAREFLAEFDK